MEVKQIAGLINTVTAEISGEIDPLQEDLSNTVAVGESLQNAQGLDAYVRALPNMIGRMVFVNRRYAGSAPSVLRDGWEYGSIMMKVRGALPDAEENEAWELRDQTVYEMDMFHKPDVSVEFVNKRVTFEIPLSITERQVKQSFHSAQELNAFIDMIYNEVDKSMTVKLDGLIMRAVNNMIAETINDGVGSTYTNSSVRAVNLLKLYKDQNPAATITAADAIYDKDFIRFAIFTISKYRDYMKRMNVNFNMEGMHRFTPEEYCRTILLTDFAKAAGVYLYDANGQFRTDNLSLGDIETVPYWQGSGDDFAFSDLSTINVKTASNGAVVNVSGVLGVMFDRDAIVVTNEERYVTTAPYNAKGEFWNSWHKWICGYSNFFDENCVVFFIHD